MVEAGPKPITSVRLSRRAALKGAAGTIAGAAAVPVAASAPALPDAHLLDLERALRAASADWRRASDRLAEAERRLFAMRPVPPQEIMVPESKSSDHLVVPERWAALRRHLRRLHRDDPALGVRLAAAHALWAEYHAARDRLVNAEWYIAAQAAEEEAGAAVEALHRRIGQVAAQSWSGLRVKLQVLWDRTGHRPGDSDQGDWDISEQILWSALQDAQRTEASA